MVMASKLLGFFQRSLKKSPVLTNSTVYASFYLAADLSQQTFNKRFSPEKPEINYVASARLASVGGTVFAPILYYWYRFLDKKFVGTASKTVLKKVAADQLIITPLLLFLFYSILGILEGKEDIFEEMRQKYVMTFLANQCFWIPGQTINFLYMPPHLRVVYVASASFIWINVLCFIKRQKIEKPTIE